MVFFFFQTYLCLIFIYYERLDRLVKRRAYQDVPDATLPGTSSGSTIGVVDGDYYNDEGGATAVVDSSAYYLPSHNNWNRWNTAATKVREWAGTAIARVWNGRARHKPRNKRTKASAKTV